MAPQAQHAIPTDASLPHSHRLSSQNTEVRRTIGKLSRDSLVDLALLWLKKKNRPFCQPYLYRDHDAELEANTDLDPAHDHEELEEIYKELRTRKASKKEVAERILDCDWRRGISLYQLATAETQHLLDHPTSLKWSALRVEKLRGSKKRNDIEEVSNTTDHLPRFHAATWLKNFAHEVSPFLKAHFYLNAIKGMPVNLLRVYIHDSANISEASLNSASLSSKPSSDGSKSVFIAFPLGSPFVYVSIASGVGQTVGSEALSLRKVVVDAVPKALSKPHSRYELRPTSFSCRTLSTLLTFRGPGQSNAAAGGWSIFVDSSFNQNALDFAVCPTRPPVEKKATPESGDADKENAAPDAGKPDKRKRGRSDSRTSDSLETKRRKDIAAGRFGTSARENDGQGIERLEVRIDDSFPSTSRITAPAAPEASELPAAQRNKRGRRSRPSLLDKSVEESGNDGDDDTWRPDVRVTFHGSHVFAGIRQLVEKGVVDGEVMPGWMTGEAAVTVGVVRDGKVLKRKDGVV